MSKYNQPNEIVKHKFFAYVKEARGRSEQTIDCIRKAIMRYELYTGYKDFKTFNEHQATAFKKWLREQTNKQGEALSLSTLDHTLRHLKLFFEWLTREAGYKSKLDIRDIDYLCLSEKEERASQSSNHDHYPTIEQVRHVIHSMPCKTETERRDQALIAFTLLTGIRVSALISLKLKHIDVIEGCVKQNPHEVKTKFSKMITTYFISSVGQDMIDIVYAWVKYLREEKLFGNDAPLFPRTSLGQDENYQFKASGLVPEHWQGANQVRAIFKRAFSEAGLDYYNPHSFRHTLADLGRSISTTIQEFEAWSLNLGHTSFLTTLNSYGQLSVREQGRLIKNLKAE